MAQNVLSDDRAPSGEVDAQWVAVAERFLKRWNLAIDLSHHYRH